MSLGDVVDLAILTFEELRGLARRHSIDGLDSMACEEVVGKLREAGVGVLHSSAAGVVERLDEMMRIVASISDELAALRDDRGREIKAAEEKGVPLLEVEVPPPAADSVGTYSAAVQSSPWPQVRDRDNVRGRPSTSRTTRYQSHPGTQVTSHVTVPTSTTRSTAHSSGSKTAVTSYYQRSPKQSATLRAASRTKCKALYVGNVHPGCSAESIEKWCSDRGVFVIKCSVSETKYFGLAFAHMVLPESDLERSMSADFWPETLCVREWRFASDRIATSYN